MNKEKSLVEEALIQMKNLEETVSENAKGILASTMKQEIKDLVKESLTEQDEDEIEDENEDNSDNDFDMDFEDEESEDEMDDEMEDESDNFNIGDEVEDEDDEAVIDLTKETNPENVLKVFQLMGPDDKIVVTKDETGNINVKDNETNKEYMIVNESDELHNEEMFEFEEMDEDYNDEDLEEIINSVFKENDDVEMEESDVLYEIEFDDEEEEEESYEVNEEEEEESYDLDEVMEAFKPKGKGISKPKFKYDSKPNQDKGFNTKMKQGPKSVGTGKAKFDYKDGENLDGEFKVNPKVKKDETKEGVRTLGAGSKAGRKGGLPKPRTGSAFNTALKENTSEKEIQVLKEKNEEYRNALNVFRDKLNEVAVFNSNLAYATRLFTEHTTSKQEKINILKRFDNVETIKESKNLYQTIKEELTTKTSKPINESIENTIVNTPTNGSAVNLIESKTYENPQFLRMKDLMSKIK
jgi:hypothetical protein